MRLDKLKDLYPEVMTEGKVDWHALRAALGESVDASPERYSFGWAGKRESVRALQVPTTATLVSAPDEGVHPDTSRNVFVEAENLEALKILHKSYHGQVKCITIDVPYNTGNDFVYPDDYADPLAQYLKITGQSDSEGNLLTSRPETAGRYHSAWLSMMYPRLLLARQFLRDDGVIFVFIDDHELQTS